MIGTEGVQTEVLVTLLTSTAMPPWTCPISSGYFINVWYNLFWCPQKLLHICQFWVPLNHFILYAQTLFLIKRWKISKWLASASNIHLKNISTRENVNYFITVLWLGYSFEWMFGEMAFRPKQQVPRRRGYDRNDVKRLFWAAYELKSRSLSFTWMTFTKAPDPVSACGQDTNLYYAHTLCFNNRRCWLPESIISQTCWCWSD